MNLSFRNRIALYFLVTTAGLVALFYIVIYWEVSRTVFAQLDSDLSKEADEILQNIIVSDSNINFADLDEWKEKEHIQIEVNPTFIQIVDPLGMILHKTQNLFDRELTFFPEKKLRLYTNAQLANGLVRQVQAPIVNQQKKILGYVLVAVPLDEANLVLNNLFKVLFFSYPIILLILFLTTRFIAGESIRPINEIIATAERITRQNLEERIKLPARRDELYRLVTTINKLLDRVQETIVREKQFTADASHELRTPIAAVKGTLEVLIRRPRTVEHYQGKIQYCLSELNRMSNLIEQLLLLARYDGGEFEPQVRVVDPAAHIEDVIKRMEKIFCEKSVKIEFRNNMSLRVVADPVLLEIIFMNVLSNAIKYSPPQTSVKIELQKKEDIVVCYIQDQGIGIPPEKIRHVFERFYRVDESRSSREAGFGLGLAIVKKLADLQHFDVTINSVESKGTTVIIKMPLLETNAEN